MPPCSKPMQEHPSRVLCPSSSAYGLGADLESASLRHAAARLDPGPLFKSPITGPAAADVLTRVVTLNIAKSAIGPVSYAPWCTAPGKLIDDCSVASMIAQF